MIFSGYRRPDGKVGIRNHVLIIPSVNCANHVVRSIAKNVPGTVWVEHQHGCSQLARDSQQTARVLIGHGTNPNVFGVVVVGLGCETVSAQDIAAAISKECPYKGVHCVIIQEAGGSLKAIEDGARAALRMVQQASLSLRTEVDLSGLILGTECGGSDSCSGLSANPALGEACNLLIKAGGTAILAETTELIGAEHILAKRAIKDEIGARLIAMVQSFEESVLQRGEDIRGANPSPGNIAGGISSIEEKSLGCLYKAGTTALIDVIDYAAPIEKKGLIFMNSPGNDIEQLSGMVASGCQICVFTTGRGTPTGSAIVPTIKVASNSALYNRMTENMDLNAGTILTGEETIQEVGRRIFAEMIQVAQGKLTKAEILGHNDFAVWRIGPTM